MIAWGSRDCLSRGCLQGDHAKISEAKTVLPAKGGIPEEIVARGVK